MVYVYVVKHMEVCVVVDFLFFRSFVRPFIPIEHLKSMHAKSCRPSQYREGEKGYPNNGDGWERKLDFMKPG